MCSSIMVKPGNCPWQLQLSSYYYFWPSVSIIPREEKIKLNRNENSIGHLRVGCLQKNSPATKQSWIAEQQRKCVGTKSWFHGCLKTVPKSCDPARTRMTKSLLPRFPATLQQLAGIDGFFAESHISPPYVVLPSLLLNPPLWLNHPHRSRPQCRW